MSLSPTISSTTVPYNPNIAWNNSWITVNNDQGIPLFAQVVYPVNITEQLTTITNVLCAILAKP
ncbi:MAG: hypothetical protein EBU90_01170 [Proteobacteria bacterium]|nr:hypothetical protein [Pseudomonadota bacterium]NBP13028.1 hypothetical protein [bacterium]